MLLSNVLTKLENIAKESSNTEKRALLKAYLNNDVFKKVIEFMFTEDMTYNIKSFPMSDRPSTAQNTGQLFIFLEELAGKSGATNKDKEKLSLLAGNLATREVVERIITKKSKAGFSVRSVNAAFPGLIFQTPYQRCSGPKNLERVTMPAIIQKKADGMFSYASSTFNNMFLSRRGKSYNLLGNLEKQMVMYEQRLNRMFPDPIFMGEMTLVDKNGNVMPRKKGNGILNKFLSKTGTEEQAQQATFSVWDVISKEDFEKGKSNVPYKTRWKALNSAFSLEYTPQEEAIIMESLLTTGVGERIQLIENAMVENLKQAQDFYTQMRDQGEEGAILKDFQSEWKNNTAPDMVKMKRFLQAEFRIVGVKEGQNKYKGMMGALEVSSREGAILCSVGSGFTDNERLDMDYWEDSIDKIITVQFESIISDKSKKDHSLFLPTFVETRFNEKTEADTIDTIREMSNDV